MKISKSKHYSIKKIKEGKTTAIHITIDDNFSLFRYRAINKYTTEQFINDDLVATCPSGFNDPYDATVRFSEKRIKRHIREKLLNNQSFLEWLLSENHLKPSQINTMVNLIYQRDLSPNIKFNNDVYAFACFSTDVTQEIMWAHYANLATGFALEYDFKQLRTISVEHQNFIHGLMMNLDYLKDYDFENDIINDPLLPIVYENAKRDVTDDLIEYIDLVLDKLEKFREYNPFNLSLEILKKENNSKKHLDFIQNVYFKKKLFWNYENEWRLICYNSNAFIGQIYNYWVTIGKIVPKAVYLGEKISDFDKNAIIDIASKKGIDVYQMKTSFVANTLKLKPVKITKKY